VKGAYKVPKAYEKFLEEMFPEYYHNCYLKARQEIYQKYYHIGKQELYQKYYQGAKQEMFQRYYRKYYQKTKLENLKEIYLNLLNMNIPRQELLKALMLTENELQEIEKMIQDQEEK
jgi:hypothetical protein